jgi:hypothetical protein
MDRRAIFFLCAALAAFVLVPVAGADFAWVAVTVGVTYVVLAIASALDAWSRSRR